MNPPTSTSPALVRHEEDSPKERSACGWRHLLLSRQDKERGIAAWAHAVDIDGARAHYHKRSTELYYVLEGEGRMRLDQEEIELHKGVLVYVPRGVKHKAWGTLKALITCIPPGVLQDVHELE